MKEMSLIVFGCTSLALFIVFGFPIMEYFREEAGLNRISSEAHKEWEEHDTINGKYSYLPPWDVAWLKRFLGWTFGLIFFATIICIAVLLKE